jgi:RES domain-containing protein
MTRSVWRIAADTATYGADDLSGKGAEKTGGRWNRKGTSVIYASQSIALACLETVVHLGGAEPLPLNRHLIQIEIPPTAWDTRTVFNASAHVGWDALPAGLVSIDWGTQWARSRRSLVAEVPSIVVPEEFNVLLNPDHPDASTLNVQKVRRWALNHRLT